jgi:hypothetical protein
MEPFVFIRLIRREMSVVLDLAKSSQVGGQAQDWKELQLKLILVFVIDAPTAY